MKFSKIINKYLAEHKWVLVFAILMAWVGGVLAWRGDKYDVSLSLTVSRAGAQNTGDYQYDGYYALLAGNEFGDAVAGWFKTPETAREIYKKAGLDFSLRGLAGLSRKFMAAKISPTTVEVRYSAQNESDARDISQGIGAMAAAKANMIGFISNQSVAFAVAAGEPVITAASSGIFKNAGIGFLLGLVFGFFVKTGKEFFSK